MKPINFKVTILSMIFLLALSLVNKSFSQSSDNIYTSLENGSVDLIKHKRKAEQDIAYHTEEKKELANQNKNDKTTEQDSSFKKGKNWFQNPTAIRYMFTSSGYSVGKGKGYYQNYMLFGNFAGYGFTDNLTLGVGIGIVPLHELHVPFSANAKYTIPIVDNKWNAGTGLFYSYIDGEQQAIGYGVVTYGSMDTNLSAGVGFVWSNYEPAVKPVLALNGMIRLTKNFALVGESWFITSKKFTYSYDATTQEIVKTFKNYEFDFLYGLSLRFMVKWGSLDIGMTNYFYGEAVPSVSINIPFGK